MCLCFERGGQCRCSLSITHITLILCEISQLFVLADVSACSFILLYFKLLKNGYMWLAIVFVSFARNLFINSVPFVFRCMRAWISGDWLDEDAVHWISDISLCLNLQLLFSISRLSCLANLMTVSLSIRMVSDNAFLRTAYIAIFTCYNPLLHEMQILQEQHCCFKWFTDVVLLYLQGISCPFFNLSELIIEKVWYSLVYLPAALNDQF